MLIAAIGLGVLIGLSLGALGGGGSIITVPALVYALGQSPTAAATESLVIVGVTAVVAMAGHARARNVRWGTGFTFGLAGVASSYAGTALARHADPNVLLLAFAVLIVVAAVAMRRRPPARAAAAIVMPQLELVASGAPPRRPAAVPSAPEVEAPDPVGHLRRRSPKTAGKILAGGLVVGFLTGFFGVGGGFLIVPALVMALGFDMPLAVGTSLLVIAMNSAVALLARAGSETFDWSVIIPFTLAAIAGSVAGKRIADRVPTATLTKAFVYLLFAVAAYVAIRSGVALVS